MSLAAVIYEYEDEIICDLAETYHIYNYRALPVRTLAVLVSGLRTGSRLIRALSKSEYTTEALLLGRLVDEAAFIAWTYTEDSRKGRNRPVSVLNQMLGKSTSNKAIKSFKTPAEFEAARLKALGG